MGVGSGRNVCMAKHIYAVFGKFLVSYHARTLDRMTSTTTMLMMMMMMPLLDDEGEYMYGSIDSRLD